MKRILHNEFVKILHIVIDQETKNICNYNDAFGLIHFHLNNKVIRLYLNMINKCD